MRTITEPGTGHWLKCLPYCVLAFLLCGIPGVTPAYSQQVLFDFDNAPYQTSLPIDQTVNGLTAHFKATDDGFSIQNVNALGFTPPGLSGRCIYPNSVNPSDLLIKFEWPLTDFSIMYSCEEVGCGDAATMRLTAYWQGALVGTNTKMARFPGTWPVDTLACSLARGFDSVVVHYDHRPSRCATYGVIYLADNMRVTPFGALYHTIVPSVGPHGSISPTGNYLVPDGGTLHFSITTDLGYHLDSLLIDDDPVTPDTGYTFNNITASHSIRAVFANNSYLIASSAGAHGTLSPLGQSIVLYGDSIRFSIVPDSGYSLDSLIVDGAVNIDSTSGFTFRRIVAKHQIHVAFVPGLSLVHVRLDYRWNLISLPFAVPDSTKTALFPKALSSAYAYEKTYVTYPTLRRGTGYWLKFSRPDTVNIAGAPFTRLDIPVSAGWNLVGGISISVPANAIILSSPEMTRSKVYRYFNGYQESTFLEPGIGYWVKVNRNGVLSIVAPGSE